MYNFICVFEYGLREYWFDECRERCILIEVIFFRWVLLFYELKFVSKELKME